MIRVCLTDDCPELAAALAERDIAAVREPDAALIVVRVTGDTDLEGLLADVRMHWPVPIALLVDGDESDVVAALDAGAEEALPGTASTELVAARIAALCRRCASRLIVLGELVIDTVERRIWRGGRPIALLPREYRLLLELAQVPGEVVRRAHLLERVCGVGFDPGTNVLDVHVSRLRAKLDRGAAFAMLRTEKGVGYRLLVPPAPALAKLPMYAHY